jgi:16S rRNA (uracil1498-N3)-methyltransferase
MRKKGILFNEVQWNQLLDTKEASLLDGQRKHFEKVLRRSIYEFIALNGNGQLVSGIVEDNKFHASGSLISIQRKTEVSIIAANLKKKASEFLVQKLTEIGVANITFFNTEYAHSELEEDTRLDAIAKNACEQSFNPFLPKITLTAQTLYDLRLDANQVYYGDVNSPEKLGPTESKSVAMLIGPEGGWSDKELTWLKNNFRGVSFSANVLRAETASIVASGILLS